MKSLAKQAESAKEKKLFYKEILGVFFEQVETHGRASLPKRFFVPLRMTGECARNDSLFFLCVLCVLGEKQNC
ncbi:MAG: hypothetical protein BWK80_06490 [Desulfobacteraceae bacterium IS3]|nr:MAG: hypothetical protein BWK80_06490 [Desulfobacteraceae bacterium IS3]